MRRITRAEYMRLRKRNQVKRTKRGFWLMGVR
jgi:hypothetical protein